MLNNKDNYVKKILMVNHYGLIGGAGVSLYHIAKAFKSMADQYDVVVYSPADPPCMSDWLEKNGIKVYRASSTPTILSHYSGCSKPILSMFSLNNLRKIKTKRGWEEIKTAIQRIEPDIIAVNTMTLCWLGPLIKKMNKKLVCFHRETYAKGMLGVRTGYIKHLLANYFDLVVFISKYDLEKTGPLRSYAAVITDKVKLEEYQIGNKEELRQELGLRADAHIIVYLGGISRLKGAHLALHALAKLKDKNSRLLFLQFGIEKRIKSFRDCSTIRQKLKFILGFDYEADLLRSIDEYKLWDRIDFVPTLLEPAKYIVASDVVVFPSTAPHQARPVFEAGAARRPVIITDFANTKEYAKNMFNCLTFRNGDADELAKKLEMLKSDKKLYVFLAENNYLNAKTTHDFHNLPEELHELFQNL